jgi:hypothetical protein
MNAARSATKAGKTSTCTYSKLTTPSIGAIKRDATSDVEVLLLKEMRNREDEWSGPAPSLTGYGYCYPFLEGDDNASVCSDVAEDNNASTSSEVSYGVLDYLTDPDDEYEPVKSNFTLSLPRKKGITAILPVSQLIYGSLIEEEYLPEA